MAKRRRRVNVDVQQLDKLVDKTGEVLLDEDERGTLKTAIHAMAEQLAATYRTTEKTAKLFDQPPVFEDASTEARKPKPGHGRNGAIEFIGATRWA